VISVISIENGITWVSICDYTDSGITATEVIAILLVRPMDYV